MKKFDLYTWLGKTDIKASTGGIKKDEKNNGLGAILGSALALKNKLGGLHILVDQKDIGRNEVETYLSWFKTHLPDLEIELKYFDIISPIEHNDIFQKVGEYLYDQEKKSGVLPKQMIFQMTSGTPAMQVVWCLHKGLDFEEATLYQINPQGELLDISGPDFLKAIHLKKERFFNKEFQYPFFKPQSQTMQNVYSMVNKYAHNDYPVLIWGASGTGKEHVANHIHDCSPRSKTGKFVAVDCGSISPTTLYSELFGHVKGAYTDAKEDRKGKFEEAHKGTIFLDEIGNLSMDIQVALLRVLQKKEIVRLGSNDVVKVDYRLLAATNADLWDMVKKGTFREDLYFRLAVLQINLPTLNDRAEDMRMIVEKIIQDHLKDSNTSYKLTPKGEEYLIGQTWTQGNIRKLEMVIKRALVELDFSKSKSLDEEILKVAYESLMDYHPLTQQTVDCKIIPSIPEEDDVQSAINHVKRSYVNKALETSGGKVKDAAKRIGLEEKTFRNWMKDLGIEINKDK